MGGPSFWGGPLIPSPRATGLGPALWLDEVAENLTVMGPFDVFVLVVVWFLFLRAPALRT